MSPQPIEQALGTLLRPGEVGRIGLERLFVLPCCWLRRRLEHGRVEVPKAPPQGPHPLQPALREAAEGLGAPVLLCGDLGACFA